MFEIEKNGAVSILKAAQPINADSIEACWRTSDKILQAIAPRVVLDLTLIPLFDSRGLEWVLDFQDRCKALGGNVVLANPSQLCRDILDITIVGDRCAVYDDVLSAIGSYAS